MNYVNVSKLTKMIKWNFGSLKHFAPSPKIWILQRLPSRFFWRNPPSVIKLKLSKKNSACRFLFDELVLVVGKKHRLNTKKEVSIGEIEKEKWILFERGASIRRATDDFFKKVKIEPETSLESNDTYFIKIMIEHGLGISLMPAWAVREEIKNGKLAQVKIKKHELRRSVAMVSMKGQQSAPIRAFTEYILENREKLQTLALNEKSVEN